MPLNYEVFDPNKPSHLEAAKTISAWSQNEHMLPLSAAKMSEHPLGLLAHDDDGTLIGYQAVTEQYADDTFEVGGMIVDPEQRGKGHGTKIAAAVIAIAQQTHPDAQFLAFCNEGSGKIFTHLGFEEVDDAAQVPATALELCQTCPMFTQRKVGQLCCDIILCLKPSSPAQPMPEAGV